MRENRDHWRSTFEKDLFWETETERLADKETKNERKKESGMSCFKSFPHLSLSPLRSLLSFLPPSVFPSIALCLIPPSPPALLARSRSPSLSPPLTPPLPAAIGQVSTNHSRTGAWGTAYAKRCLIFMSCYRGFKSLIRTAAQLSVPTAWLAGCVCT